jgi:hypothetical protein
MIYLNHLGYLFARVNFPEDLNMKLSENLSIRITLSLSYHNYHRTIQRTRELEYSSEHKVQFPVV